MRRPTQSEIDEAKAFLKKRLEAELSMKNNLMDLLVVAANKIIAIAYKYNVPPRQFSFTYNPAMQREIEAVIDWLRWNIEDFTETLAVADHEDGDSIIAYAFREQYGKTFQTRVGEYSSRFRDELQTFIAAAFFRGMSQRATTMSFVENIDNPIFSDVVVDAVHDGSDLMQRLHVRTTYGKGRRLSASGALTDLTTHAVAEGWKKDLVNNCGKRGVYGYWCGRGSSYPCEQCDYECSYFHTEWDSLPPFHNHCRCYAIPIYWDEII